MTDLPRDRPEDSIAGKMVRDLGIALAQRLHRGDAFRLAAARIREARPTAVNLAWAVDRVLARADGNVLAEAEAIHAEQREIDARTGRPRVGFR